MKIGNKILIIMIISISILFTLLTVTNYAENETEGTGNNVSQTENNATESDQTINKTNTASEKKETTNNDTKKDTKSSNANLSDLGITPHDFTGFKYGTTYYEVSVPENTESVEVYAKLQDDKAQITGTGKKKLEKGENKAEVTVIAEDGTKKTYTINIIREIQQEQEANDEKINDKEENTEEEINIEDGNGLLELKIGDLQLSPEFATDVYEYTVKYIGEETKLNIETKATNQDYVVEVTGNSDLQEGENIIIILVSDSKGENVATYQITLNKSLVDYEAIAREEENRKKMIISAVVVVIVIVIIAIIIIKRKKNRKIENEFWVSNFDNNVEDIPMALKESPKASYEFDENNDNVEDVPREILREEYLNNYSNHDIDDYKGSKTKKTRGKGKRYK